MKKHDRELHAMKVCAMALENLTGPERLRVLAWLGDVTDEMFPSIRYTDMTETEE